jgi:anthranilate 1,2-dioxygenase large subunit
MSVPIPAARVWPSEGVTRVPYWVYQDEAIYRAEQERIFRGAAWNFVGLEVELPNAGDFKSTFVGEMPVILARDDNGELHAFENRCAHRGALICFKERGNARRFTWGHN